MQLRIRLGLFVLFFVILLPITALTYASIPIHANKAVLEALFVTNAPQLDGTIDPQEHGDGTPLTLPLAAYGPNFEPLPDHAPLPLTFWGAYDTSHLYLGIYVPDPTKTTLESTPDGFAIGFDQGPDGGSRDYRLTTGSEDNKRIDARGTLLDAYWKVDESYEQPCCWQWDDEINLTIGAAMKIDFQAIMGHNTTGWHIEFSIPFGKQQDLRNLEPGDVLGFKCNYLENEEHLHFRYPANYRDLQAWPEIHLIPSATTSSTQTTNIPGWEWLPTLGALGLGVFLLSRRKLQTH